jgi:hypothetical protein
MIRAGSSRYHGAHRLRGPTVGDAYGSIRADMAADRAQVAAMHRQMLALLGGFMIALIGLLAAVVAQL